MKKLLLSTSIFTGLSTLALSPIVVASCSKFKIEEGDLGRNDQLQLLSSPEAKQIVLDTWLTKTFVSLYADNVLDKKNDESTITSLNFYLEKLQWNQDSKLDQTQKANFEKLIFDAFKFYVTFKSTISTSDNPNPRTYFFLKANEWKKAEYTPIDEEMSLQIGDFNPTIGYLPPIQTSGPEFESFKNDFKILMSTRGTAIYSEVLKLLLCEMYFMYAQKDQIIQGTNYNKLTSKVGSLDYINAKAFNINKLDYFLTKYLVDKNPQITWSYTDLDYKIDTEYPTISTYQQFNNINPTKINNIYDSISIKTPDTLADGTLNLSKLKAYNGVITNSEESAGDLSNNIEDIKTFSSSMVGLLDDNKLISFSKLEAINELRKLNASNAKVGVPAINIKDASKEKQANILTMSDFEMTFNGNNASVVGEKLILEMNDQYNQKWELNNLSFTPFESETYEIVVSVKYTFTINSKNYVLDYNFILKNWNNGKDSAENPFKEEYTFIASLDSPASKIFPSSISILDNGKPKGVKYILRVLPQFNRQQTGIKIGNKYYMLGEFSLDNTLWNNDEEKRKLAYFFMLSDSSLFTTIKDYYLFNNFTIESSQDETKNIIKELGLSSKTKKDREQAGLPI